MIRVFPRRTQWTPTDELCFVGDPPLFRPPEQEVRISVAFTWDLEEGWRLFKAWRDFYGDVRMGGPAFGDREGQFEPGVFLAPGVTITSRGCPNRCWFCKVWKRNGDLTEYEIRPGWNIQDDNILRTSDEHFWEVMRMLAKQKHPAFFGGGLEARALTEERARGIAMLRPGRVYLAYDDPRSAEDFKALKRAVDLFFSVGMRASDHVLSCYVMVGFPGDSMERAEKRLMEVAQLGVMPMALLYRNDFGRHEDPKWMGFQKRWCRPWHYSLKKRAFFQKRAA